MTNFDLHKKEIKLNKTKDLIRKLCNLRLAPVSNGANELIAILKNELKFNVIEFPTGKEVNGWVIPQKWEVKKALLKKDGKVIYDGMNHPLGVICYSQSFNGEINLRDLKITCIIIKINQML